MLSFEGVAHTGIRSITPRFDNEILLLFCLLFTHSSVSSVPIIEAVLSRRRQVIRISRLSFKIGKMKTFLFLLMTSALFFLFQEHAYSQKKSRNQFINEKMDKLMDNSDTVIVYFRGFGGSCIGGLEGSVYFLYLKDRKYYMEYYRWKKGSEKFIQRFKTTKKEKEIKAVLRYACKNVDCMASTDKSKIQIDISDGIYAWYLLKFKSSVLRIDVNGNSDIRPYIDNAPCIGNFLLVLNMLYYRYSFDGLLDM